MAHVSISGHHHLSPVITIYLWSSPSISRHHHLSPVITIYIPSSPSISPSSPSISRHHHLSPVPLGAPVITGVATTHWATLGSHWRPTLRCYDTHMISIRVWYGYGWHSDQMSRRRVRCGLSECHLNPYRTVMDALIWKFTNLGCEPTQCDMASELYFTMKRDLMYWMFYDPKHRECRQMTWFLTLPSLGNCRLGNWQGGSAWRVLGSGWNPFPGAPPTTWLSCIGTPVKVLFICIKSISESCTYNLNFTEIMAFSIMFINAQIHHYHTITINSYAMK